MIETKYIPQENVHKLLDLLYKAKELHEGVLRFKVYDSEGHVVSTLNPIRVITEIDGGDEQVSIKFVDYESKKYLGIVFNLPYEQDGIAFDYSDNEFIERLMNE